MWDSANNKLLPKRYFCSILNHVSDYFSNSSNIISVDDIIVDTRLSAGMVISASNGLRSTSSGLYST